MLALSNPAVSSLIQITSSGIATASFDEVYQTLLERYKEIYGNEVDLSTGTADGIYLYNEAKLIDSILQVVQFISDNLNISKASGEYLDVLMKLLNIKRNDATYSTASLTCTNLSNSAQTFDGMTFVDKSGQTWSTDETITFGASGSGTDVQTVSVKCDIVGPVIAPIGWINKTLTNSYISVSQTVAAKIGFERETDASLKARAHTQLSLGQSTVESIAGALLNIEGIMDVKIYNNNTAASISAKDTTGVAAHNVYIIIRKRNDITIADQDVGTAIHDVLIPGIRTTQAVADGHSYTYVESVNSIATLYYPNQVIYWKQTQGTTLGGVTIDVEPTAYFMQGELDAVAVKIMQWLNGLPIGTTLRELDCSAKMTELDPRPKGNPSYSFIQVTSLVQDNPDRYYEFTQYTVHYDNVTGYYNINLS